MKIKGTVTTVENVKVDVSVRDLEDKIKTGCFSSEAMLVGLERNFKEVIGIREDARLVKGNWNHEWEVRGGSHGWWDDEDIRPATKNEKSFMKMLQHMREAYTVAKLETEEGELVGD